MKAIKWLKMCYPGMDLGAVYEVTKEQDGFLWIVDEWGRPRTVHLRYLGILFVEVDHV